MCVHAADVLSMVKGLGPLDAGQKYDFAAKDARFEDVAVPFLTVREEAEGVTTECQGLAQERQAHGARRQW